MLGLDSGQRSFFDAGLAVEGLLEKGSFYEVLYRLGPKLLSDGDFAECYDVTTGRPSVPPTRMFKLVLLQAYEDLSDRKALERMAFDLRWKAVLGLEVHDRPVGQATLVEFRARVQVHQKMEEAFGRFVRGLLEAGVISAKGVQLVDSSAIWGRGAVQDTYNLIGSAVRKLLGVTARRQNRSAGEVAGEIGLLLTAPAQSGSLKGRAEIDWSDPEERRALLNRLVQEARQVLQAVSGEELKDDPAVAEAAALLRRILVQDLASVSDPEGPQGPAGRAGEESEQRVLELDQEVEIRQGVARDRVVSVGDPEMRHGHKSRDRRWDGYKAHVSVEAEHGFITAVEISQANVHDGEAAPDLIEQAREQGMEPTAVVGDMAYSTAELRRWAAEAGTEIVAQVPPASARKGCFSKDAFAINLDAQTVTCPAGYTTAQGSPRADGGHTIHFAGTVCADCTLREQCTIKDPDRMRSTGRGRAISWHPLEGVLHAARIAQGSERVQRLLSRRWLVEQGIARLMRRGLRQARYMGKEKVHYQALAAALVTNLVKLANLTTGGPAPAFAGNTR